MSSVRVSYGGPFFHFDLLSSLRPGLKPKRKAEAGSLRPDAHCSALWTWRRRPLSAKRKKDRRTFLPQGVPSMAEMTVEKVEVAAASSLSVSVSAEPSKSALRSRLSTGTLTTRKRRPGAPLASRVGAGWSAWKIVRGGTRTTPTRFQKGIMQRESRSEKQVLEAVGREQKIALSTPKSFPWLLSPHSLSKDPRTKLYWPPP